jgi:1-acyl-sn-glycerol-3-phosphate acyltransferase
MAEGSVFITGRSKDIIIRAGRNIYPAELEEAIGKIEGIREGNVAVFGSKSSESGTERLIILAETRKKDDQARADIRTSINTAVTDLVGGPPDEVVLAPPNTVLKTSSGKIRRNASRDIFEHGLIGKPQQAVWVQITRFIAKGLKPRLRSFYLQTRAGLYAVWCWLLYSLLAPIVGILVFLLPAEKLRWPVMRLAVRILAIFTGTKITVLSSGNLPQKDEPCIFVSNHASYLDAYVITAVVDRPFSFIAKAELQSKFIIHILLKRIGTLFVERFDQQKGIEDAKIITEKGAAGRSLFFFPEGTFMRMPGLLPFRMGAFETAARTGLPLVPIAIRGTRSILRSDSWFPRHGKVSVTFGKPITVEKTYSADQDTWSAALHLRDKTRNWLLKHCAEPDLGHERPRLQPNGPTLKR